MRFPLVAEMKPNTLIGKDLLLAEFDLLDKHQKKLLQDFLQLLPDICGLARLHFFIKVGTRST